MRDQLVTDSRVTIITVAMCDYFATFFGGGTEMFRGAREMHFSAE